MSFNAIYCSNFNCKKLIGYIEGPKEGLGNLGGPKYYCHLCGGRKKIEEREKTK